MVVADDVDDDGEGEEAAGEPAEDWSAEPDSGRGCERDKESASGTDKE